MKEQDNETREFENMVISGFCDYMLDPTLPEDAPVNDLFVNGLAQLHIERASTLGAMFFGYLVGWVRGAYSACDVSGALSAENA